MKNIVDELISINYDEINNIKLDFFKKTGLIVNYKNCKYEFLIHLVDFDDNLIIFGSSFLSPIGKIKFKNKPFFERHSWIDEIKHNALYYNDPTLYDFEEIDGGWGIGTPNNWHLENISNIVKKIADKIFNYNELNIPHYGNLFFYGGSMGGFMSIILSILIPNSTSIADSPQFNLFSWWYWDFLKKYCFKGLSDEEIIQFSYKLDIIDLINLKKVIPNTYIILDCSDQRDWDTQIKPFLNRLNSMPYLYNSENNNLNLHFVGKCIEHNMLPKYETLTFIDNVISLQNKKFHSNQNKMEMLVDFKKEIENIFSNYNENVFTYDQFIKMIKIYLNKWKSCRVDIKNIGNQNNTIEILEQNDTTVEFPKWFDDEKGTGCVINSIKPLNIRIKCINKGQLSLIFRGNDYRNYNQKRTPIHICYNNLKINNKLMFSKDFYQWHDRPYTFTQECEDNDIIDIKIEFKTIENLFPNLNKLINSLNENEKEVENNYKILINYIDRCIEES